MDSEAPGCHHRRFDEHHHPARRRRRPCWPCSTPPPTRWPPPSPPRAERGLSRRAPWPVPQRPHRRRRRARGAQAVPVSGCSRRRAGCTAADRRRRRRCRGGGRSARRLHQRRSGRAVVRHVAVRRRRCGPLVAVVADLARDVRFEAVRGGGARRAAAARSSRSSCRRAATDVAEAIVGLSGWPPVHSRLGAVPLARCRRPRPLRRGQRCARRATSTAASTPTGRGTTSGGVLVCQEAGPPWPMPSDESSPCSTTTSGARRWRPRRRALLDALVAARRGFR